MSSTTHFLLTVFLLFLVGYRVEGRWGWWDWSESKPANCPHEDQETHICSSLSSANGTCVSIRCCTEEDGVEDEYDESMGADSDSFMYEDGGHHRRHRHGGCRLCVSVRNCTAYKCRRYCCEGYTVDFYGRCVKETTQIDCQNGGSPRLEYIGTWSCLCPQNFTGTHCETPVCHCENGGQCTVGLFGRTTCACRQGFSGPNCSQPICSMRCENGGSCVVDGDAEMCVCPNNFVGKTCQDYHVNDLQCPVTDTRWSPPDCFDECDDTLKCSGNQLCCKEGCSRVCRPPKDATCQKDGRTYRAGASVPHNDPCMNCTCTSSGEVMCAAMSCVRCANPVLQQTTTTEQCCPVCADVPERRPPRFDNCPCWHVNVTVEPGTNKAYLQPLADRLTATDYKGEKTRITISPGYLFHCGCATSRQKVTEVIATARDSYGGSTQCRFRVLVTDQEPPRFHSCPDDIYVFEEEVVTWEEPRYSDNVGVYYTKFNKDSKDRRYSPGVYNISYTVVDFEYNYAVCDFQIVSMSRDTDYNKMPEGMRQRATDRPFPVTVVVAPIVGFLVLVVGLVLLLLCCRRRRRQAQASRRRRPQLGQNYDNNIYAVCGPPASIKDMKLPNYTLPSNPPPYSSDMTEGEYAYVAPPSYKEVDDTKKNVFDNPAYEKVAMDTKGKKTEHGEKE